MAPFSTVMAPAPLTEGMLNENAWGEPTWGRPRRLKRIRNIAWASVAVPTVDRALAPIRSWSDEDRRAEILQRVDVRPTELAHELLYERRIGLVDQPLRLVGDGGEHER